MYRNNNMSMDFTTTALTSISQVATGITARRTLSGDYIREFFLRDLDKHVKLRTELNLYLDMGRLNIEMISYTQSDESSMVRYSTHKEIDVTLLAPKHTQTHLLVPPVLSMFLQYRKHCPYNQSPHHH